MLKLERKWVWDSWYCHDDAQWHAFFLQADKSLGDPKLRHWNVTHGHAVSPDLNPVVLSGHGDGDRRVPGL
jgi:beta-fructofuranosidase